VLRVVLFPSLVNRICILRLSPTSNRSIASLHGAVARPTLLDLITVDVLRTSR
jgi:hypothetical protein